MLILLSSIGYIEKNPGYSDKLINSFSIKTFFSLAQVVQQFTHRKQLVRFVLWQKGLKLHRLLRRLSVNLANMYAANLLF